jgi:hypothetical protein
LNYSDYYTSSDFIYLLIFQMHCCGVDNYEDFTKATEFVQYTREEGLGQVIPESCCVLADRVEAQQLFIPKDDNCITAPTTTNSYMNKVGVIQLEHS